MTKSTSDTSVAAIIPSFRRWPYLLATIDQLLSQTSVPDEIIVIDQTPRDEIRSDDRQRLELLQSKHYRLIYRHQQIPQVYRARNLAASIAQSNLLLYLDDDVILNHDFVEQHLLIMADETIDATVGRITHSSPSTPSRQEIPRSTCPIKVAFQFTNYRDDRHVDGIAYCAAGNICIRRVALIDVGGWDEHILTYGDKDLGLRLYAAGKRIVYSPRPSMVHLVAGEGGTRLTGRRAPWSSWQRAVSIHYVAMRHLKGWNFLRFGLWRAARHTFLLRQNVVRPWRWLSELFGFLRGFFIARSWLQEGVRSSFHSNASSPMNLTAGDRCTPSNSISERISDVQDHHAAGTSKAVETVLSDADAPPPMDQPSITSRATR